MKKSEHKTTTIIASIYAFRMLGLFMILPIFSLYTEKLKYATPTLIGLALGIYGLTQGILQIPLGMWGDRIGRKPVIIFGLILFLLGSIVAALAHNIYGIIIGRALQGGGAIGSTLMALVADTTEDKHRLKAMAVIGMTIGFSFVLAMVLGPILNNFVGLSGIFGLTGILAILGMIMLLAIPTPTSHPVHPEAEPVLSQFNNILKMPQLWRLNFGIFTLHAILTALFIVVPIVLLENLNLNANAQWMLYVPVLLIACILMVPFIIIAEKYRMQPIFVGAIIVLTLCTLVLGMFQQSIVLIGVVLCLFFTAFTFLEAALPSLISKTAPKQSKGTAMGVYSSCQFLGIFFGGSIGGLLLNHFGAPSIFIFTTILGGLWALLSFI